MRSAPNSHRLQVGIFGRRNVGKSALMNGLAGQTVSIVSTVPGTTTDPVDKAMELFPLGPVVLIDTAGLDDEGLLGAERMKRSAAALDRIDVAIVVLVTGGIGDDTAALIAELQKRRIASLAVFNKCDLDPPTAVELEWVKERGLPVVLVSAENKTGFEELLTVLNGAAPTEHEQTPPLVADLVGSGQVALLVAPVDAEAPKGRLILPQAQTIRELLDANAIAVVVTEGQISRALESLRQPPVLVITDSQAFARVNAEVPDPIALTSFSILMARARGDLALLVDGARTVDQLQPGSRILIAESCTHHAVGDDIGTVKLPKWLTQHVGGPLDFSFVHGRDFPDDLASYALVIHCGSCMLNRRETMARLGRCAELNVPVTNYGVAIAKMLGILDRALSPFEAFLASPRVKTD